MKINENLKIAKIKSHFQSIMILQARFPEVESIEKEQPTSFNIAQV